MRKPSNWLHTGPLLITTAIWTSFAGCAAFQQPPPPETIEKVSHDLRVFPLPGGLNETWMLHSNSPERVEQSGILVSSLPPAKLEDKRKLGVALQGEFGLFLHHVARTPPLSSSRLYLAVVASNPAERETALKVKQGAFFRTWPEAPFYALSGIQNNDSGQIFAGAGDRLSLAWLRGENTIEPRAVQLPAHAHRVLLLEAVPTNPLWVLQQDNALSGLFQFQSEDPVYLSTLAWVSQTGEPPQEKDLIQMLESGLAAGPEEAPATAYISGQPPPRGVFRYGRVAGIGNGSEWQGQLNPLPVEVGERVGFPIASVYLKRLGTQQNQSAPLHKRVSETAIESHGNYGLKYSLKAQLHNPDTRPRRYAIYLHNPLEVRLQPDLPHQAEAIFQTSRSAAVRFRGSLLLSWKVDSADKIEESLMHQILHEGEEAGALKIFELPAQSSSELKIELVYPPDATPPQLLELQRLS
ncbi:MAG: DUF3370 family protein [Candidatus Sericytochromatia bacterium]